jgi:hypothetical protein
MEVIGSGKHSSLLRHCNNYGRNKFYDTGPWSLKKCKQSICSVTLNSNVLTFFQTISNLMLAMKDNQGLYYKHITIVNGDSRVVRMTSQVMASPTMVILTTLVVSFMLLENIYSTDITYNSHLRLSKYFYCTGLRGLYCKTFYSSN